MKEFSGRIAVVTGGGSGMGRELGNSAASLTCNYEFHRSLGHSVHLTLLKLIVNGCQECLTRRRQVLSQIECHSSDL